MVGSPVTHRSHYLVVIVVVITIVIVVIFALIDEIEKWRRLKRN